MGHSCCCYCHNGLARWQVTGWCTRKKKQDSLLAPAQGLDVPEHSNSSCINSFSAHRKYSCLIFILYSLPSLLPKGTLENSESNREQQLKHVADVRNIYLVTITLAVREDSLQILAEQMFSDVPRYLDDVSLLVVNGRRSSASWATWGCGNQTLLTETCEVRKLAGPPWQTRPDGQSIKGRRESRVNRLWVQALTFTSRCNSGN